jgi:hypothetical protein
VKERGELETWLAQARKWQNFQIFGDKADASHGRGKKKLGR